MPRVRTTADVRRFMEIDGVADDFDRWLAGYTASVRAEALEAAALAWEISEDFDHVAWGPEPAGWLRSRAEREHRDA